MLWPAQAQALKISKEAERFVAGATTHTIHHEIAHMLIDQLQLPTVGREEDAADQYAWLRMLEAWNETGDEGPIRAAIRLWHLEHRRAADEDDRVPAWSEHSTDRQRLFLGICMVAGADRDTFGDLARQYRMPAERLDACEEEAEYIRIAWDELVNTVPPTNGKAVQLVIEKWSGSPSVTAAPTTSLQDHAEWMLRKDVVPVRRFVDDLNSRFGFEVQIALRFANCDEPDAYYDPEVPEVVICYEEIDSYSGLLRYR